MVVYWVFIRVVYALAWTETSHVQDIELINYADGVFI